MPDQAFKVLVYEACQALLNERLERLQKRIKNLQGDLQSESKSTAGDKHETGRAMLQLEMEKLSGQLQNVQHQLALLVRIPYEKNSDQVVSGSLLKWGTSWYFMSLGLGEITIKDEQVFCLAPSAPLGQALLGKQEGASVRFRQLDQQINQLL
jgi:DNA repair exonuclease SbcCD ATPase subunit